MRYSLSIFLLFLIPYVVFGGPGPLKYFDPVTARDVRAGVMGNSDGSLSTPAGTDLSLSGGSGANKVRLGSTVSPSDGQAIDLAINESGDDDESFTLDDVGNVARLLGYNASSGILTLGTDEVFGNKVSQFQLGVGGDFLGEVNYFEMYSGGEIYLSADTEMNLRCETDLTMWSDSGDVEIYAGDEIHVQGSETLLLQNFLRVQKRHRTQTLNDTPVEVTHFTTTEGKVYWVRAVIIGTQTTGGTDSGVWVIEGHLKNSGGNVSVILTTPVLHSEEDASWEASITGNGADITITLVGDDTQSVWWDVIIELAEGI